MQQCTKVKTSPVKTSRNLGLRTPKTVIICALLKTGPSIIQVPFAKFFWFINHEFSNPKSFRGVCLVLRHWNTPNDRWKGADLVQAGHSNVNKPTIINSTSNFSDFNNSVIAKKNPNITPTTKGHNRKVHFSRLYNKHAKSLVKLCSDVVTPNKPYSIHGNFFFFDINKKSRPKCTVCVNLIYSHWVSIDTCQI